MSGEEGVMKWQPVIMVVNNRVECKCGVLAVFVSVDTSSSVSKFEYIDAWCQQCFTSYMDDIAEQDE